jgi:hypothetical protein
MHGFGVDPDRASRRRIHMETRYNSGDREPVRMNDRRGRPSMAAPFVALGGLIVLVGAFLDWASTKGAAVANGGGGANGGNGVTFSGYNLPDGRVVAGIGAALLIMAALMWVNRRAGSWFDADLLGVAPSAIALLVAVTFLMDVGSAGRSAELGVYVSLVGSLIALGGAVAALLRSGSDRATADVSGRGDIGRRAA